MTIKELRTKEGLSQAAMAKRLAVMTFMMALSEPAICNKR